MKDIVIKGEINIENLIYEVRGKQVILDSDLARLYKVETKRVNEAVKNNPLKFPERFAFRITEEEYSSLKSKISTSKGGSRKGHTAFTEQGVAMLATILKSKVAIDITIGIMDAFVAMRHYIGNNLMRLSNVESKVIEHDIEINLLQESFKKFEEKKIINEIYYNGQIYDAYSKLVDILMEGKEKLIIIDSYAGKVLLDMISKIKIEVVLIKLGIII